MPYAPRAPNTGRNVYAAAEFDRAQGAYGIGYISSRQGHCERVKGQGGLYQNAGIESRSLCRGGARVFEGSPKDWQCRVERAAWFGRFGISSSGSVQVSHKMECARGLFG